MKNSDLDLSVTDTLDELSDCMVDSIEVEKQKIITENITKPTLTQKELLKIWKKKNNKKNFSQKKHKIILRMR